MAALADPKNPEVISVRQWIKQFIEVYGHGAVTRFNKRSLGVSLVRTIQALELGTITAAKRIKDDVIDCTIEYVEDDGENEKVVVTVVVNVIVRYAPPVLRIGRVEERKESPSGTNHAA